jgi:phosphoribosylformylglycinamidine synthase
MLAVEEFARQGKLVLGICNGFQILCEAGLLPGALMRNAHLQFRCQWVHLRVESTLSPFAGTAAQGEILRIPISHGDGNYYADRDTIDELESEGRVVFRYCSAAGETSEEANPNGSLGNIAGIVNRGGNVLGMMPHPERCCEPVVGGTDGSVIFESLIGTVLSTPVASS